jgi:Flp pilus assembly protein TadG
MRREIDAGRNQRGALSPAVVILAVMIFTLAGLVIDGGRQLGAKSRAVGYAQEAARAGAATIDLNSPEAKIDITKAGDAVATFCAEVSANDPAVTNCGTSELDDQHLQVKVRIDNKTTFLGMVGIQDLPANGVGEAHAEQGVTKAEETPKIPPIFVSRVSEGPGAPITSTAVPPTLDIPCPTWTIGSPSPTPTGSPPFPFPPTCLPTAIPTDTTAPTGGPTTGAPPTTKPTSGGGGPGSTTAPRNSVPPSGGG